MTEQLRPAELVRKLDGILDEAVDDFYRLAHPIPTIRNRIITLFTSHQRRSGGNKEMTELSKTEQELIDIIQTAWCDISATPDDRFGDFLKRAAMRIKQAGWTSPAEIKEIDEHIQEQVNNDPNYMLRVFIESGEWQEFVGVER